VQEYTLAFLKPDCFKRELTNAIIRIIEESGFVIVRQKEVRLKLFQIETIYLNFKHKQCFPGFVEFL